MGSLNTSFGLRAPGADDVDIQLTKSSPELGRSRSLGRVSLVDPENGRSVAVEGNRFAVLFHVAARCVKVVEGRLADDETHLHEPACGVVDVDKQGAPRAAVLEPLVVASIYLNQLAATLAAVARLMDLLPTRGSRYPEPSFAHPLPQSLPGDADIMNFPELLSGEGRPEVSVVLTHQSQRQLLEVFWVAMIARLATMLGYQSCGPMKPVGAAEPLDVSEAQPQRLAGLNLGHSLLKRPSDDVEPIQLSRAHRENRRCHADLRDWLSRNPTFLTCGNPTSL
jgi:hypothetical protein